MAPPDRRRRSRERKREGSSRRLFLSLWVHFFWAGPLHRWSFPISRHLRMRRQTREENKVLSQCGCSRETLTSQRATHLNENLPKGEETTQTSRNTSSRSTSDWVWRPKELSESTWIVVLPVSETDSIVIWSSTEVDYDPSNDQNDYGNDFCETEPELQEVETEE